MNRRSFVKGLLAAQVALVVSRVCPNVVAHQTNKGNVGLGSVDNYSITAHIGQEYNLSSLAWEDIATKPDKFLPRLHRTHPEYHI